MITKVLGRWLISIAMAVVAISALGLVLNQAPVQARVNAVHDWPGVGPCNASLQQCIDLVPADDVIHILPGTYTQSVTLNKPVSLIGNDPATTILFAEPFQRVLTVTGNLTASTVISGLMFRGGILNGSVCPDACGGGLLISGTARPSLNRLLIDNNSAYQGGGLWVEAGPVVVVVDSKIISNSASHAGGGLYSGANVRLIDVLIERNQSSDNGGGLEVTGALEATNTVVVSNTANNGGGGARVAAGATLNFGRWEGNVAGYFGGGLFAEDLIMTGTLFINNEGNGYGGGAYVNGPGQLRDGRFERNRALGFGGAGGLYVSELHASGTQFFSNTAGSPTAYGGGAYVAAGVADLNLVRFEDNSTAGAGGALYVSGPVTLTKAHFVNNQAGLTGGGVYAGGTLFLLDSRLENNVSHFSSGGGAFTQNSAVIVNSVVVSNSAALQGGGLQAEAGANLLRAEFVRNVGAQRGGGLDVAGSLDIMHSVFSNNTSAIGGGVFHTAGGDGRVVNSLFVRNVTSDTSASALHLASTGHVDVINTTIADPAGQPFNPAAAIQLESGSLNITNTIVADHAVGVFNNGATASEDYNLFSNVSTIVSGPVTLGGHDQYPATPQFVDPVNDNYHLRLTSDAIDHGTDAGVYVDIDGQPRPIGAGFDIGFDERAATIQEQIDSTPPGGTVNIPAGVYTESLTLYKPVNLVGAGAGSTIINAAPSDRVLTVTGSTILPATQIVSLTLRGGRLTDCVGFCAGGGVLITGTAYPSFRNVVINDNQAVMGAGLYIHTGGAQLFDSSVVGNQAAQSGGGAYIETTNATLEQFGGTFGGNRAIDGAGVFVQSGEFRQTGGVIYGNTASNWGGGMLIGGGGMIQTWVGQIISNSALNAGGGVFVDVGTAELRDSLIISNTAHDGGGVYVRDLAGTGAAVIGGKLESNFADAGGGYGGGIYAGGTLLITGTKFFKNAAYDGSALEITGTAQVRLANAFIAGNRANGVFPSTNSSVRFDSSGNSVVLHTTFGNATEVLTRALTVNSGVVTVANTIVASYTNGLSQFGGRLAEDYNLFFRTPVTFTGSISNGGHSLFGLDPLFKGAAIGDYHIKGLSPAVNRGTNAGVRRDIDLDPRPLGGGFDIGADEASVAGMTPGLNTGGSFTYTTMQNSTIYLNVPPGAVTQTVPIYCSLIETSTVQPPRRFKFAGVLFELDAQLDPLNDSTPGSINFSVPVTLAVSYTDEELASAGISDETSMKIYRFEPSVNDWKPIGYRPGETQTLDVDNNLITATVWGFSRFGSMGTPQGSIEIFLPLIVRN